MKKPLKELNVNSMTRKDFMNLPCREWSEDIGKFTNLIILPTKHKHDSGFACMDFVACFHDSPICRLSGCSDVINIGGIGAPILDNSFNTLKASVNIDCLFKSKLLRLFIHKYKLTCGSALSSFELFFHKE